MSNDWEAAPSASVLSGRRALCALVLNALLPVPAFSQHRVQAQAMLPETAISTLGDALLRRAGLLARPAAYVFSPYGLHATLGLLALGARGRTAREFCALLGGERNGSPDRLAALLARGHKAAGAAGTAMEFGQSAWTKRGQAFEAVWQRRIRNAAAAHLGRLDFAAPGAVPTINAWAARATRGEIPIIVDHLPPGAELVLAGAIHFAGEWSSRFPPENTAPALFRRLDGGASPVPMMRTELDADYGADGIGHAVRLGYRGGRLALWAATARRPEETDRFLAALAATGTATWLQALPMHPGRVAVQLPRLAFSAGGDVLPALNGAGFARALSGDFSGILGRPVRPSEILHRARIRIDEKGTVAAAATSVTATRSLRSLEEFSADRPFVFVLGLVEPWLPLFMGYVGDAAAAVA